MVTVIALTGPPSAGKSTIAEMLSDQGVPVKDTGDVIRARAAENYSDPDEDEVWQVAQELREKHGDGAPTNLIENWVEKQVMKNDEDVLCVSSLRNQAEVDWLREVVGPTLVVRVDADPHARSERYIEDRLDQRESQTRKDPSDSQNPKDPDEDREAISQQRVQELREELYDRERREQPYPEHDVSIRNEESVAMHQIWDRLEHLVEVIRS